MNYFAFVVRHNPIVATLSRSTENSSVMIDCKLTTIPGVLCVKDMTKDDENFLHLGEHNERREEYKNILFLINFKPLLDFLSYVKGNGPHLFFS